MSPRDPSSPPSRPDPAIGSAPQEDQPASESTAPPSAKTRDARTSRWARPLGILIALAPVGAVVATDFANRGGRLLALPPKYLASYSAAIAESAVLWVSLVWVAAARSGAARWIAAVLFVILFTVAVGGQIYFHDQYSTYLNLDATLFGTSLAGSVFGQLGADGKNFLRSVLPPLFFSIIVVAISRRVVIPTTKSLWFARILAPLAVVAVFLIPTSYRKVQASTPDVIYFHAIGGLIKELTGVRTTAQIRPGLRTPPALPALPAKPAVQRDVILLLTESVRADCHCSAHVEDCAVAPESNAAVPGRIPLLQLRANATTTAIQLSVLWSGLEPVETRERLHSVPLLFDYAHAAGWGNAYWTSHHMMFANSRLYVQDLPTDHQCGATDLEAEADIDTGGDDGLLVDRALAELPLLKEPFFATVHVGNTHVPYKVDPAVSPFQPSASSKAEEDNQAYFNFYRNAVFLQDKHLGRFLRELRKTDYGQRTVVIFTSDHGESFREHEALGHTGTLYEEELRVPGWVDAPPGTLTPEERKNLEARREWPTFSTDVMPTVLDLMGLWGSPALEPYLVGVVGQSWLRPPKDQPTLALSNCSGVWGCAFRNWGVMRGWKKLHAREWDSDWHCFDVLADPAEKNDLGPAGCADLVPVAEKVHDGFPGTKK